MRTNVKTSRDDLADAQRAVASLCRKLRKVLPKLRKGTAQHALARNRLKALRIAAALIAKEMRQSRPTRHR